MQAAKALLAIESTALGIVRDVSPVHLENASFPMTVTAFGIVTEAKLTQLQNASVPMYVTVLGMSMEVRAEQFVNVPCSIDVISSGSFTYLKLLQLEKA